MAGDFASVAEEARSRARLRSPKPVSSGNWTLPSSWQPSAVESLGFHPIG